MKSRVCKWQLPRFLEVCFLHDEWGPFVGAACRSLTPAQRVLSRSEWRPIAVERNGAGPFVGELRERIGLACLLGWQSRMFDYATIRGVNAFRSFVPVRK